MPIAFVISCKSTVANISKAFAFSFDDDNPSTIKTPIRYYHGWASVALFFLFFTFSSFFICCCCVFIGRNFFYYYSFNLSSQRSRSILSFVTSPSLSGALPEKDKLREQRSLCFAGRFLFLFVSPSSLWMIISWLYFFFLLSVVSHSQTTDTRATLTVDKNENPLYESPTTRIIRLGLLDFFSFGFVFLFSI